MPYHLFMRLRFQAQIKPIWLEVVPRRKPFAKYIESIVLNISEALKPNYVETQALNNQVKYEAQVQSQAGSRPGLGLHHP